MQQPHQRIYVIGRFTWGFPLSGDVPPEYAAQLEKVVKDFQSRWALEPEKQSFLGNIQSLAPPDESPLRNPALIRLICADMRVRWSKGQRRSLDEYLKYFTSLGSPESCSVELLLSELELHQQFGGKSALEIVMSRYPTRRDELAMLRPNLFGVSAKHELRKTLRSEEKVVQLTPDKLRNNVGPGYKIFRKIGEGNYGEVWLAEAPGGIEVALKCIRFPVGTEINDRELRGLQLMKNMRHPFLLQVQAFWTIENQLVIAMELADGSLGQLARKNDSRVPRKELLQYLREAAEGIDYLHQQNVVHRDIKPDNILMLKGHAKVADFGLARFIDETGLSTAATQLAGSPAYMAPEAWGQQWQPASDQYSLAIMYVELRTGRLPFDSESPYAAMQDHMNRKPNLDGLPENERAIVGRSLAKNPSKRFHDCVALIDALTTTDTIVYPRPSKKQSTRGLWIWLPSLVALLALIVAIVAIGTNAFPNRSIWLPEEGSFAPVAQTPVVRLDGRWLHERIIARLPDGKQLNFVLVKVTPNPDLRSFYIMETELPNFAFAQFVASRQEPVDDASTQWVDGAMAGVEDLGIEGEQANLPVVSVSRDMAEECAIWLGGVLPSASQWDAAAGLGRNDWPFNGPYRTDKISDEIYTAGTGDRVKQGPLPVGSSIDDESIFGVKDLAGNVEEWTRDFTDLGTKLQCIFRGNSYHEPSRWNFNDQRRSWLRNEANALRGFRVVIQIPPFNL